MRSLTILFTLCAFGNVLAEPLATGTVTRILKAESLWLDFTVSDNAKPGIRFYPMIRFVLEDDTWIDGHLGCFPTSVYAGRRSGGTIEVLGGAIPAARTLKYVAVVAAVGDPTESFLVSDLGHPMAPLNHRVLEDLKKAGGIILRFPLAEQNAAGQPATRHESK